jgi:hypothetical protein
MIIYMGARTFFRCWIVALCAGLVLAGWALPVRAQTGTLISVQPPVIQVPVGSSLLIDVVVVNGVDVNAFDITITYDADILSLQAWEYGDYLANLWTITQQNQPGLLRVAAAQLATPPVTGDGVLLVLTFTALAPGVTDVTIDRAEFADALGNKTIPELAHGTVTGLSAPTYTLTPTFTRTPTVTATRTSTPTATFTPSFSATARATSTPTVTTPSGLQAPTDSRPSNRTGAPSASPVVTQPGQALTPPVLATAAPGTQVAATDLTGLPEGAAPSPSDADSPGEALPVQSQPQDGWLVGLLWGALIFATLAIGVMILILLRRNSRRKHHEEDLLL